MTRFFLDTSAFCALADRSDAMHQRAVDFLRLLQGQYARLVTSDVIVEETYTRLLQSLGHRAAWAFKDRLDASQMDVFPVTTEVKTRAWQIARDYGDKLFSFVDCMSFALVRLHNITRAFAFDHHFEQFGLQLEPRPSS